jgi:hypothetical protein
MFDQQECIFCLEPFKLNTNLVNNCFYKKNLFMYQQEIINVLDDTLVIKCNHIFHYGCFLKYIKIKYKLWKTYEYNNDNFFINCPFCRIKMIPKDLKSIMLLKNDNFHKIKSQIKIEIKSLKKYMNLYKTKLYVKKIFFIKNDISDIYKYQLMTENYEEWCFLYDKLQYILNDINVFLNDIDID